MKHVAGQGPIYVRTLQKINLLELQVVESFIFLWRKGCFPCWEGINTWFSCDKNVAQTLIVILCVHSLDRVHFCCWQHRLTCHLPFVYKFDFYLFLDSDGEEDCQTTAEIPETTEPESNIEITSRCSEVSSPVDRQSVSAVEPWTIQDRDNIRML